MTHSTVCVFIPYSVLDMETKMVRVSKRAQQVKVLTARQLEAKPDTLSLTPRTHRVLWKDGGHYVVGRSRLAGLVSSNASWGPSLHNLAWSELRHKGSPSKTVSMSIGESSCQHMSSWERIPTTDSISEALGNTEHL